jgi:hypothetical protein
MRLLSFLRSLTGFRSHLSSDMEEELRSHIQHRADDLERSGVLRPEAERRAQIEFGGYVRYKEESYEASGGHLFETLLQDLRFAVRVLRKSPNFTAVAVSTLALGIGANAVVFGVMNALVLRPLDLPQAQKLYMIERGQRGMDQDSSPMQSYPDYRDLRDRNRSFDGLIAYAIDTAGLDTGGSPSPIWLYEASGNYFDVLAESLQGRSGCGWALRSAEQTSLYDPRSGATTVSRHRVVLQSGFLGADRKHGTDRRG